MGQKLKRTIHVGATFSVGRSSGIMPDVTIEFADPGQEPETDPICITIHHPEDNDLHIIVLADKARQELVRQLSGGIVLAGPTDITNINGAM